MTAVVAQPSQPAAIVKTQDSPSDARKRRREILASQRTVCPDAVLSAISDILPDIVADATAASRPVIKLPDPGTSVKRRRVSLPPSSAVVSSPMTETVEAAALVSTDASTESAKKAKKPQMKYDPAEPMSKEEAAVWRREQRRKRNRESAAASRQRQRDRITELEAEVQDWKAKFDNIMQRITELERLKTKSRDKDKAGSSTPVAESIDVQAVDCESKFVSPPASPAHSSRFAPSPVASPTSVASSSLFHTGVDKVLMGKSADKGTPKGTEHRLKASDKMIPRHAMS